MTDGRADVDAGARRAILEALDETLVVEAAAGTGKTTELVNRVLRVLATGRATMRQIVAVTFTEKAAGELKLKLRAALESGRSEATSDEVRTRLEDALGTLEEAHVDTIHGFCAELLRERPVEAAVDPLFTVLDQPQTERLYARAFRLWLQEALRDPPEGLRRALRRSSSQAFQGGADADGPVDRVLSAGLDLVKWRGFSHPWRRPPFDRAAAIDHLVAGLHRFDELTASPSWDRDNLFADTGAVRRLSRQIRLEQSFGQRDLDGWEARLVDLARDRRFSRPRKGSGYRFGKVAGKDVTRTEVLAARDALFAEVQQFRRDADADLAACLQADLAAATSAYEKLKAAAGALDFTDLLARARDLIVNNGEVREHLQRKFTRLFVDEFQDTDPIQAEILLLLAADNPRECDCRRVRAVPGKLFIVGDSKQAIYRFRGTDVSTYWDVSRQLERGGGCVVQLMTSYRSVPSIQSFVNAAFERAMIADDRTVQAGYVPLAQSRPEHEAQPSLVALPVPRPYGRRGPATAWAIEESLPDAVGAFIAWIVDGKNGWTVSERGADGNDRRVPIQPRHIAVLFRRFVKYTEDVTRRYVDAIEARGIPHLLVGGKAFHGRPEVETIRAALAAIEWPDDELSVFATLKGSLFAIDDEHLLEFRHRFGVFHPFRVPKELGGNSGEELALVGDSIGQLRPIADALRLLQQLHRRRNYRPVADTIGRLLAETRAHVGFVLRPAGEQALANVLHVAELARQYEVGGGISFRGFIDELREAAESIEVAEAPILEEGSDGVRLMTVHKAKGLEFPVVILADLTCQMSRNEASRYLDPSRRLCAMKIAGWAPHDLHEHEQEEIARDQAEGVRLAYVAATRARDLLVVPAVGDEPWEGGWLSPLNIALYPPLASRRSPSRNAKWSMLKPFKSKDSVLERPNDETAGPATVSPGVHVFDGGYSIVWWDPAALALDAEAPFGVRRQDLIAKDVPQSVIAEGRSQYDRWRLAREDARAAGGVPSLTVETVREWTMPEDRSLPDTVADLAARVAVLDLTVPVPAGEDSIGGPEFGVLVHAILGRAPLDSKRKALEDLAAVEARAFGLSENEIRTAAATAERVLAHDLLARARRAEARGACRRETPVACAMPDGSLVEGIADLAFEEHGSWTIVDYKTDRELAASGEKRYRRQIALYAWAVGRATGTDVSCVLVRV